MSLQLLGGGIWAYFIRHPHPYHIIYFIFTNISHGYQFITVLKQLSMQSENSNINMIILPFGHLFPHVLLKFYNINKLNSLHIWDLTCQTLYVSLYINNIRHICIVYNIVLY